MWLFPRRSPGTRMNKAYRVFSEWGPKSREPRPERLKSAFRDVDPEVLQAWMDEFERVDRTVWVFAEEGGPKAYTWRSFCAAGRARHPWMDRKSLGRAWFLTRYYAWHEGYDR